MRLRFKTTSTQTQEAVYTYKEEDWYYCVSCLEKKRQRNKMFKIKKRAGSVIEIKCHRCGGIETIEI